VPDAELEGAGFVVFAPVFGPLTVEPEDGESDGLPVGLGELVGEPVGVGELVGEPPVAVAVGDPVDDGVLVGVPVDDGALDGEAEDVLDGLAAGEPLGVGQFGVAVLVLNGAADGIAVGPEPDVT
jgi:hypothetical protein